MTRGGQIALGIGGVVGVALVANALRPSTKKRKASTKKRPKAWTSGAQEEIRELAQILEDNLGWIDFGDFLVAKAWTESRGVARAGSSGQNNKARGWFGLRPNSAFAHDLSYLATEYPNLLKDKRWAVAMAAWYAKRLRPWAFDGQTIDWLALARGWAFPSRVADVNETKQRSRDTRRRFEYAVAKAGRDPDLFMYERAFRPGWSWPGVAAVLKMLGAEAPTAADAGVAGRHRGIVLPAGPANVGGYRRRLLAHFDWEERVLFPRLPRGARDQLMREHWILRKPGASAAAIIDHAHREEEWMAPYISAGDLAHLKLDHRELHPPRARAQLRGRMAA